MNEIYLKQFNDTIGTTITGNLQRTFAKFVHGHHVGAVLQQQGHSFSVTVLNGPVQSRHFQHIFGIHIGTVVDEHLQNDDVTFFCRHLQRRSIDFGLGVSENAGVQQQFYGVAVAGFGCRV